MRKMFSVTANDCRPAWAGIRAADTNERARTTGGRSRRSACNEERGDCYDGTRAQHRVQLNEAFDASHATLLLWCEMKRRPKWDKGRGCDVGGEKVKMRCRWKGHCVAGVRSNIFSPIEGRQPFTMTDTASYPSKIYITSNKYIKRHLVGVRVFIGLCVSIYLYFFFFFLKHCWQSLSTVVLDVRFSLLFFS